MCHTVSMSLSNVRSLLGFHVWKGLMLRSVEGNVLGAIIVTMLHCDSVDIAHLYSSAVNTLM